MTRFLFPALLLLLGGCTFAPPSSRAPEPPSVIRAAGILPGETVWTGTVRMEDDVVVPAGGRLVVEPGTTVLVRISESTKIEPEQLSPETELLVRGIIEVQGTAEAPVRFLPATAPEEGKIGWAGLILDGAQGSRVSGARIERADVGILCIGSSPLLVGNHLEGCRYGIIAQQGSAPRIQDNRLLRGEGGIFCWRGSNPLVLENEIVGHEEEGIFVDADSRPRLEGNLISGNAIGLAHFPADLPLAGNRVEGNGEDLRRLGALP